MRRVSRRLCRSESMRIIIGTWRRPPLRTCIRRRTTAPCPRPGSRASPIGPRSWHSSRCPKPADPSGIARRPSGSGARPWHSRASPSSCRMTSTASRPPACSSLRRTCCAAGDATVSWRPSSPIPSFGRAGLGRGLPPCPDAERARRPGRPHLLRTPRVRAGPQDRLRRQTDGDVPRGVSAFRRKPPVTGSRGSQTLRPQIHRPVRKRGRAQRRGIA